MLNLLTSEIYQVKQKRSTYLWLLLSIVFSFALSQFLRIMNHLATQQANSIDEDGVTFEVTSELLEITPEINAEFAAFVFVSLGIIILLLSSYHTFNSSLSNRMIVNSVMHGFPRAQIFIAKYLIAAAFFLLLIFLSFVSFTLGSSWGLGGSFSLYFKWIIRDTLLLYLLEWLFYLAIMISFYFVFDSIMPLLLFYVVELLINTVISNLAEYSEWVNNISPYLFFNLDPLKPQIYTGINLTQIASLGYLILFLIIGMAVFQHQEIK